MTGPEQGAASADLLTPWERQRVASVEATLGSLPLYASRAWYALEPTDPRRWASVIRAAACWRDSCRLESIDERIQAELERVDQLAVERVRAASHAVAGAADWNALAAEPTHADLAQRRAS